MNVLDFMDESGPKWTRMDRNGREWTNVASLVHFGPFPVHVHGIARVYPPSETIAKLASLSSSEGAT